MKVYVVLATQYPASSQIVGVYGPELKSLAWKKQKEWPDEVETGKTRTRYEEGYRTWLFEEEVIEKE